MTALTRCPIDGSRIYRNHAGEIECSVALIGNHSQAVMLRAYADMHAEAPSRPATASGLGEPCPTCGKPKQGVSIANWAYCEPCTSRRGHTGFMPKFLLKGQKVLSYFDDTGRMTR